MHPSAIDETGKRYGRWTVVGRSVRPRGKTGMYWAVACDCGSAAMVSGHSLRDGHSRSCGCLNRELIARSISKPEATGTRYGRVVVLGPAPRPEEARNQGRRWRCRCDCGRVFVARGSSLRRGTTKSCGCKVGENFGVRLAYGEAAARAAVRSVRGAARVRDLECTLTDEEIRALITAPCVYCGAVESSVHRHKNGFGPFACNGIDRVDSSRGYVAGNVVSCCKWCNVAKSDRHVDDFVRWVEAAYCHLKRTGGLR